MRSFWTPILALTPILLLSSCNDKAPQKPIAKQKNTAGVKAIAEPSSADLIKSTKSALLDLKTKFYISHKSKKYNYADIIKVREKFRELVNKRVGSSDDKEGAKAQEEINAVTQLLKELIAAHEKAIYEKSPEPIKSIRKLLNIPKDYQVSVVEHHSSGSFIDKDSGEITIKIKTPKKTSYEARLNLNKAKEINLTDILRDIDKMMDPKHRTIGLARAIITHDNQEIILTHNTKANGRPMDRYFLRCKDPKTGKELAQEGRFRELDIDRRTGAGFANMNRVLPGLKDPDDDRKNKYFLEWDYKTSGKATTFAGKNVILDVFTP